MSKQRIYTKKPMVLFSSFRLPARDCDLVREAAAQQGISQCEFLRVAVKKEIQRVFRERKRNVMGEVGGPQAA